MEAAIANLNCKDAARGTIILILIMFFKVICALLYSLPFYKAMPTGVGGGGDGVGMIVVGLLSITFNLTLVCAFCNGLSNGVHGVYI